MDRTNQKGNTLMDIICPRCGEPLELDALHDNPEDLPFKQALAVFRDPTRGCGQLFNGRPCEDRHSLEAARMAGALFDLYGDDVDGVASDLEDLGYTA